MVAAAAEERPVEERPVEGREAKESEAKEGCAPGLEPAAMRAKRPTDGAGPHPQQPQPGPEPPSELAAAQGAERDAAFSTRSARRFPPSSLRELFSRHSAVTFQLVLVFTTQGTLMPAIN